MTDHFYDFTEELGFLSESWDARKVENLIIEEIGATEGRLGYKFPGCNKLGKAIRVLESIANPVNLTLALDEVRQVEGALTPAFGTETIDGISFYFIKRISDSIKKKQFNFSPSRYHIIAAKPGSKEKRSQPEGDIYFYSFCRSPFHYVGWQIGVYLPYVLSFLPPCISRSTS